MEIEVKYQHGEACSKKLLESNLIAPYINGMRRINMLAIYYDTPNEDLGRARLALRLRREGNQYICALKGGNIENGVARRIEIEACAANISEGWEKICRAPDFITIKSLLPANSPLLHSPITFVETARMEFIRNAWDYSHNGLQCELAQDCGFIRAGQRDAKIDEFEIELKHGAEQNFLSLISKLEISASLDREAKSKYHRALDLINGRNA